MCVDHKALDKVILKNMYPVIGRRLAQLIVQADVFHQARLASTHNHWRRGKNNMCNSLWFIWILFNAIWSNKCPNYILMNGVFFDYIIALFLCIYIMWLCTVSLAELNHVRQELTWRRQHQLYVKNEKCKFAYKKIMLLARHKSEWTRRNQPLQNGQPLLRFQICDHFSA